MARVKGTVVLPIVKLLRADKERARQALPPSLHGYLSERILVTSWYPEPDYVGLLQSLARYLPKMDDVWAWMGKHSAAHDLTTIYRSLVDPHSPERTLRRGGDLWRIYHSTGDFAAELDGPGSALLQLGDYAAASPDMCHLLGAYFGELIRLSGASHVTVTESSCRAKGAPLCTWHARWEPEQRATAP
jgi:hypothetical protein